MPAAQLALLGLWAQPGGLYFKLLDVKRFVFLDNAYVDTSPARKMTWCAVS